MSASRECCDLCGDEHGIAYDCQNDPFNPINRKKKIDHSCTEFPTCPDCGYVFDDVCEIENNEVLECDCGCCFEVIFNEIITYSTEKQNNHSVTNNNEADVRS